MLFRVAMTPDLEVAPVKTYLRVGDFIRFPETFYNLTEENRCLKLFLFYIAALAKAIVAFKASIIYSHRCPCCKLVFARTLHNARQWQ